MTRRQMISATLLAYSLTWGGAAIADDWAPLDLKLPNPAYTGTPPDVIENEHVEKPSGKDRAPFLAPKGVKNLALGKKVTSSDKRPSGGELPLVTDGDKESNDSSYLELHRKLQWVQIDLESAHTLHAIVVWHAFATPHVYISVVVQVADDAEFTQNVRTLFNNDFENAAGLGQGKDKQYYENHEGKLIDAQGVKARYVRLYSNGSTLNSLNRYTEVEVYGL
jgi:hypothetical protein